MGMTRLQSRVLGSVAGLALLVAVTGCGLKGPLRLPDADAKDTAGSGEESTQARKKARTSETEEASPTTARAPGPTQDAPPADR